MRYRSTSPKKVPTQKAPYNKKNMVAPYKMKTTVALLIGAFAESGVKTDTKMPLLVQYEPTAPLAEIKTQIIVVQGDKYQVEIPEGCDVYYALQRWYPSLYEALMEEGCTNGETLSSCYPELPIYEETMTEDDNEDAWAHYDYLEWLYD
jgi:hypothetical protein